MNWRRWVILASAAALALGVALPALAQETPEDIAEIVPAVVVEESSSAEPVADWTYRFLVPTCLALALIFCVLTVVLYFTKVVRSRYKSVS
jgi:hypothetical protein